MFVTCSLSFDRAIEDLVQTEIGQMTANMDMISYFIFILG